MKACFDNVVKLTIGEDDIIEAIHSSEKEVVKLRKPCKTKEVIEKWLLNLQDLIKETLHTLLKEGTKDYNLPNTTRAQFVRTHYGQIVAAVA